MVDKAGLRGIIETLGTSKQQKGKDGGFDLLLNLSIKLVEPSDADFGRLWRTVRYSHDLKMGDITGRPSSLRAARAKDASFVLVLSKPNPEDVMTVWEALQDGEPVDFGFLIPEMDGMGGDAPAKARRGRKPKTGEAPALPENPPANVTPLHQPQASTDPEARAATEKGRRRGRAKALPSSEGEAAGAGLSPSEVGNALTKLTPPLTPPGDKPEDLSQDPSKESQDARNKRVIGEAEEILHRKPQGSGD